VQIEVRGRRQGAPRAARLWGQSFPITASLLAFRKQLDLFYLRARTQQSFVLEQQRITSR
jgi:hypothetical protein